MKYRIFLTILLVFAIFLGWHCGYEKSAPNEIVGVWKTSDQRYVDRFITIDTYTIRFGIGEGKVNIYTINKVKKTSEEGGTLYTIYYENGEGVWYKFAFYYSPENGGTMRKKNQKQIIWKKSNR